VVTAVLNSKGGTGKTVTAVGLASALAAPRRRILLVDLDSQAAASQWCGVSRNQLRPSTASVLLEKYPILKAVRHTSVPHLDLLTGSLELANADLALADVRGREAALRRTLERILEHYEIVLIDCPPGLSLLGVNAVVAADAIVVPVVPEPLAIEGVETLFASIDRIRSRMQARARVLGLVLTQVDVKRALHRETADRLRAEYRDQVFHTELRWTTALAAAPEAHQPPPPADAFRRLAGEVLHRVAALKHERG
jgi:chromosome partitioning protein